MTEYFPKPKSLGKLKCELDFSNYATKADLKNEIETHLLLKRFYLANLKSNVERLDTAKQKKCSN